MSSVITSVIAILFDKLLIVCYDVFSSIELDPNEAKRSTSQPNYNNNK